MSYEDEAKKLMEMFKAQYAMNNNPNGTEQIQSNVDIANIVNKESSSGIPTGPIPMTTTPPPKVDIPVSGGVCPQCKTLHPPLRPGESCPNSAENLEGKGIEKNLLNKYVTDIRNIIMSQMDQKKIKDGDKFFKYTIVELMKILEGYSEE